MRKILIDGLPWSFSDHELTTLFSEHGPVSGAVIIRDPVTGQSRGFGFVEMSIECAKHAVAALDGRSVRGHTLTVTAAKEQIPV